MDFPTDKVRTIPEMAKWVAEQIDGAAYIVGHSFGGKTAVAIAALHPDKVKGIFVIAGSNRGKLKYRLLKPFIKIAKLVVPEKIRRRFRAADYQNSSDTMRRVMAKTLGFDIMRLAKAVACPAVFINGSLDTITPPALGRKLAKATGGRFYELKSFNHNTIITAGIYQVSAIIKSGIKNV